MCEYMILRNDSRPFLQRTGVLYRQKEQQAGKLNSQGHVRITLQSGTKFKIHVSRSSELFSILQIFTMNGSYTIRNPSARTFNSTAVIAWEFQGQKVSV